MIFFQITLYVLTKISLDPYDGVFDLSEASFESLANGKLMEAQTNPILTHSSAATGGMPEIIFSSSTYYLVVAVILKSEEKKNQTCEQFASSL